MKVRIKDYQILKQAELEFKQGLTAIVGSTNNGKSSIIRAIRGAINNQGGSFFINYDAEEAEVEIDLGSNQITWVKSKKPGKSKYIINGETLNKIGQTQLPEVADIINMPEITVGTERFQINFWKQLEKPFLVDRTAYQLFDFISKSKEQEQIEQIQQETTDTLNTHKQELRKLDILTDNNNILLMELDYYIENNKAITKFDISKIEAYNNLYNKLDQYYNRYNYLLEQNQKEIKIINKNNKLISIIEAKLVVANQANDIIKNINQLLIQYRNNEEQINKLETGIIKFDTTSVTHKLNKLKKLMDNIDILTTLFTKYNGIREKTSQDKMELKTIKESIEQITKELSKYNKCPLCGSTLHKGKEHV